MWLSVPIMVLKSVLRSFSASPGGKAATPSKITLSAQALYWASILTVLVPTIGKPPPAVIGDHFWRSPGPVKGVGRHCGLGGPWLPDLFPAFGTREQGLRVEHRIDAAAIARGRQPGRAAIDGDVESLGLPGLQSDAGYVRDAIAVTGFQGAVETDRLVGVDDPDPGTRIDGKHAIGFARDGPDDDARRAGGLGRSREQGAGAIGVEFGVSSGTIDLDRPARRLRLGFAEAIRRNQRHPCHRRAGAERRPGDGGLDQVVEMLGVVALELEPLVAQFFRRGHGVPDS